MSIDDKRLDRIVFALESIAASLKSTVDLNQRTLDLITMNQKKPEGSA